MDFVFCYKEAMLGVFDGDGAFLDNLDGGCGRARCYEGRGDGDV